ncbi:MAG: hypothetical protein E2O79_06460 [Caldithrix sp.]|nr:MAG: hypothetical protein E2O79_06460 [Caldithrix sp.]
MKNVSDRTIRLLQGGFWKSGNYLLFRILKELLISNNLYRSAYEEFGLKEVFTRVCEPYLEFPEQAEVPILVVKNKRFAFEFHHPSLTFFNPSLESVFLNSSIIWSHEPLNYLSELLDDFTHKIFIIRKHEETLNSLMHHLVRPSIRVKTPGYNITDVRKLYAKTDVFEKYVDKYLHYLESLSRFRKNIRLINFDNLVKNKKHTILKIADFLKLNANTERIIERTSFKVFKNSNIAHARSCNPDDYKKYFSSKHYDLIEQCKKYDFLFSDS